MYRSIHVLKIQEVGDSKQNVDSSSSDDQFIVHHLSKNVTKIKCSAPYA